MASIPAERSAGVFERLPYVRSITVFLLRWAARIGVFFAIVFLWEWWVDSGRANEVIFPAPSSIWDALRSYFTSDITLDSWLFFFQPFFREHFEATILETAIGFGIGTAIGLSLAMSITMWPVIKPFLSDYIVAFEAVPKVALIPLFVTWFGIGHESKIALAITITFFPVFLTAYTGMNTVPEDYTRLVTQLKSNRFQRMRMLQFPHSLPTVFAGLKQALTNSLIGAIIAEFFGARVGLGFLISIYSFQIRTDRLFAVLIIISALALAFFLLLDLAARRLCFWAQAGSSDVTNV
ncbi:MAG: ABC transporter permease subunit [Dehalococcoidia bacterium]|nr:ABC transporter permease subunit [Dehalococcoidia bacterium]